MPDGLLGVLKLCLLALLYLFFARVLWAVGAELRGPRKAVAPPMAGPVPSPAPQRQPRPKRADRKAMQAMPSELFIVAGTARNGPSFPFDTEVTVGRAAGCAICIEDGFASQLHARVYRTEQRVMIEDLGSTNGTLVNGARITTPTPLVRSDVITIGGTSLEVR